MANASAIDQAVGRGYAVRMDHMKSPEFAVALHRNVLRLQNEYLDRGDGKRLYVMATEHNGRDTADMSKADPDCSNCGGSGIVDRMPVQWDGETQFVDVTCACVYANGGVDVSAIEDQFKTPVGRNIKGKRLGMHARTWARRRKERRRIAAKAKRR